MSVANVKMISRSPSRAVLTSRTLWARNYRPTSSFSFPGSGFTSSFNTDEPLRGPLAASSSGGVTVTPRVLKTHLDRFVVGQDASKRVLSTAIYHHYHRIQQLRRIDEEREREVEFSQPQSVCDPIQDEFVKQKIPVFVPEKRTGEGRVIHPDDTPLIIEKSNGPTGVGKTLMIRTLARILDVPFSMSDCTPFTMAGYVGEDVDQAVHRLVASANYDVRKAESGIICLDEFDKLAKPKSMHVTKDISGEGVQQALLKMIEGTIIQIQTKPERRPPQGPSSYQSSRSFNSQGSGTSASGRISKGETLSIDTSSILFIFTGAFIGLDRIISDRVAKGSMGFNAHVQGPNMKDIANDYSESNKPLDGSSQYLQRTSTLLDLTEPDDLIAYGLIPEIVGRIPVTTAVEALTEEMLVRVLTEPRNALLKQYEQLFHLSGVELRFTSPALIEIAKSALKMGTGARGLRTVVEKLLSDAMFESPGSSIKHVLVNTAVAQNKQAPLYFARGQRYKFHEMISTEEGEWKAGGNKAYVQDIDSTDDTVNLRDRVSGYA